MGGHIRMDKDLLEDERVAALRDQLAEYLPGHIARLAETLSGDELRDALRGLACDAVIGGLYRLWRHADTNLGRHNRLKGASHGLARIAEVTALPASLLAAFPPEWLHVHADGTVELPDYAAKNALMDKDHRRELGRERTRQYRIRQKERARNGDASQSVTAETSQRHNRVTTGPGYGTGTGTGPTGPGTGPVPDTPRSLAAPAGARSAEEQEQQGVAAPEHLRPLLGLPRRGNGVAKSQQQLADDARTLHERGLDAETVHGSLKGYGVTLDQVRTWIDEARGQGSA